MTVISASSFISLFFAASSVLLSAINLYHAFKHLGYVRMSGQNGMLAIESKWYVQKAIIRAMICGIIMIISVDLVFIAPLLAGGPYSVKNAEAMLLSFAIMSLLTCLLSAMNIANMEELKQAAIKYYNREGSNEEGMVS